VTADALDYATLFLYVSAELEVKETLHERESAEYIVGLTRAIAKFPYEVADSALGCVTKVKAPGGGGGGDGGDGDGARGKKTPADVWCAQLQMVPGVSAAKARTIVRRFPTFRALTDAYSSASLTVTEKQQLLQDIFKDDAGKGSRQAKLSLDLYRLFTTSDPNEVIGAGTK